MTANKSLFILVLDVPLPISGIALKYVLGYYLLIFRGRKLSMMVFLRFTVTMGVIFFYNLCSYACEQHRERQDVTTKVLAVDGNINKVNEKGEYITLPGLTVAADVAHHDGDFFEELYQGLIKIPKLKDYYALLPVASYHMTTNNIYTIRDGGKDWHIFIANKLPWFIKLNKILIEEALSPRVLLKCIKADKTMGIIVQVDDQQAQKIKTLGENFGIAGKIPPKFHITLAYLYKDIPENIRKKIRSQINKLFNDMLDKYDYRNKQMLLDQASLRYFRDMKQFLPWNGQADPF